ncbi:hypothetical protein TVAG_477110 [Trichomonas vaginalis G3]|uniref:D-glutamate cyclase-like C-terminal domain-containing protein n=1 Tax=Trichomonas vaginalis (strain ATCC PRA-98 / G3) TaxID=412133 RepID=A2DAD4_TRIV3|nr:D-glutamate cyclase protein [Trichomonas vaginalis G3]EAY22782.1 hypothetical protein TVAG_477110 [Trichomonas vaginalis G3]KAI5525593.1 D-glutamate cyclase protein [Trichomonas vaginalis G3]|eukprot:XP_001583768.1 hypothetical protein [Trichomonas vaginalis G3]
MDNKEFCHSLESVIFVDPGKRGISEFWTHGCLYEAASRILKQPKDKKSYVLTGFCCMNKNCETDGPIGTSVLCKVLRDLGFNSEILCDPCSKNVVEAAALGLPVVCASNVSELESDLSFAISIERPGRTIKTNDYRTMRARDISDVTMPLDYLFPAFNDETQKKNYLTVSVGDGGNEVGTGNVHEQVAKYVSMGSDINTVTTCDVLVLAGVSNWGGIAIAAALAVCSDNIEIAKSFIEICGRQREMLDKMLEQGSYDGISGKVIPVVDGMEFDKEHTEINNKLIAVVKEKYPSLSQ